jgi:hypothetical protein
MALSIIYLPIYFYSCSNFFIIYSFPFAPDSC